MNPDVEPLPVASHQRQRFNLASRHMVTNPSASLPFRGERQMRFGWLAAAAAMVCAVPASAATFVQYEAQGTGTVARQGNGPPTTQFGDLFFRFVLEVDPGYSDVFSYGDGSTFFFNQRDTTLSASINAGAFTLDYQATDAPRSGATASINIPGSPQTFLQIPAVSSVTGAITYGRSGGATSTTITGTVNRLVTLGTVSGFFAPSATVLPEPASWAMMILGLGTVGAALRRRNEIKKSLTTA